MAQPIKKTTILSEEERLLPAQFLKDIAALSPPYTLAGQNSQTPTPPPPMEPLSSLSFVVGEYSEIEKPQFCRNVEKLLSEVDIVKKHLLEAEARGFPVAQLRSMHNSVAEVPVEKLKGVRDACYQKHQIENQMAILKRQIPFLQNDLALLEQYQAARKDYIERLLQHQQKELIVEYIEAGLTYEAAQLAANKIIKAIKGNASIENEKKTELFEQEPRTSAVARTSSQIQDQANLQLSKRMRMEPESLEK